MGHLGPFYPFVGPQNRAVSIYHDSFLELSALAMVDRLLRPFS